MKKLLSLPPNLVNPFKELEQKDSEEWFCTSDPIGERVGSGGGTSWLLKESWEEEEKEQVFSEWLKENKRILIHAGGQSRRLPAYAPSGKILTPIPVFRWERGQKIDQNLLDLQFPLYEKILSKAPGKVNTLIASGDTYIRSEGFIEELPVADVICYGLWVNPGLAINHGVFVCDKTQPETLQYMLQKPALSELQDLSQQYLYMMDIGIWLLSDKAVQLLMKRSGYTIDDTGELIVPNNPGIYDLYSEFGLSLGCNPRFEDSEINSLKVSILPLPKGEFFHFGTSKELISSTLSIQNHVLDQRSILHKDQKPHPSMFIQNANVKISLNSKQRNLWIENSYIGNKWQIKSDHIITGIPENNWNIKLPTGVCLDIIPVGEDRFCIRPYGFNDSFRGQIGSPDTIWLDKSLQSWLTHRALDIEDLLVSTNLDIQLAPMFPVLKKTELSEGFISWMITGSPNEEYSKLWRENKRFSADNITDQSNLHRLYLQRDKLRTENIALLHKNYSKSVFYQIDLDHVAKQVAAQNIVLSSDAITSNNKFIRMHEQMFQARVKQYKNTDYMKEEQNAFQILREIILEPLSSEKLNPQLNVFSDQIVWGRSPVRIDLAGGWSDTPPNCLINGGAVVNFAVELNGQPPLHVYVKPSKKNKIILRSIDIGKREDVTTYEELEDFAQVGSAFSIAKAALVLTGFHPKYSAGKYESLEQQLNAFGSGIEISTLAAIPKGSGLGTSSILAATVLGALSDFSGLNWTQNEISYRTMVLEQLLTTGGGWQDQYGGILPGIKLLETEQGVNQIPTVKWTPDYLFTRPEYKACMLLYYTGITRTAKDILSEIVRSMFLNASPNISLIQEIKQHSYKTFDVLQRSDFDGLCANVKRTWEQKQLLDKGTNPKSVKALIKTFEDYAAAYKLPGAGGGGYMYIIAKDPEAAGRIRNILNANSPNSRARFVDMNISQTGFQVTRS